MIIITKNTDKLKDGSYATPKSIQNIYSHNQTHNCTEQGECKKTYLCQRFRHVKHLLVFILLQCCYKMDMPILDVTTNMLHKVL